jgi:hypothetical protein
MSFLPVSHGSFNKFDTVHILIVGFSYRNLTYFTIVNILLELQKNGVQVFVATHSYTLARWFELNVTKKNEIRFFNMRKTENGIAYDTAGNYSKLKQSTLEDAGDKLFNAVMKKGLEIEC